MRVIVRVLVSFSVLFILARPLEYDDHYELRYTREEAFYCEDLAFKRVGKQACDTFSPGDKDRFGIDIVNCLYKTSGQSQIKCDAKESVDICKSRMSEDQSFHVHTFGSAMYEKHCKTISMKYLIPGLRTMRKKFDETLARWRSGPKSGIKTGREVSGKIVNAIVGLDTEGKRSKESALMLQQATRASIRHFGKSHKEILVVTESLKSSVSMQQDQQRVLDTHLEELAQVLNELQKIKCGGRKRESIAVIEALLILSIDYLLVIAIPLAIDKRNTLRRRFAYWMCLGFIPSVILYKVDAQWLSISGWHRSYTALNKFMTMNGDLSSRTKHAILNSSVILKKALQISFLIYTLMYALSIVATALLPLLIKYIFSFA